MSSREQRKDDPAGLFLSDWGFTLKDLYNLCLNFYKDKQGKAVQFSYEERTKLSALHYQITHGKLNPETAVPVGVLDVVGKDRRIAWQALGDKSKGDCMFEFISTVNSRSPLFKPFVEAHKRDSEEKSRLQKVQDEERAHHNEEVMFQRELERQAEENRLKMEEQKRRIQDALNRQTFQQFLTYAEQQYPGNPEQQGPLIRQLQEQHYEQYMRQLCQQQLYAAAQQPQVITDPSTLLPQQQTSSHGLHLINNTSVEAEAQLLTEGLKSVEISSRTANMNGKSTAEHNETEDKDGSDESDEEGENKILAAASMWTRKDIKEFKESVKAEGGEAIIRIGQGESVTVRVPTHPEGSCLFWEFATDNYDVGFGLFFEWTDSEEPVSVQLSDTTSEEEEDEDDEALNAVAKDLEQGRECLPKGSRQNTDVIIPVFRRDAHQEVYVGSHLFPGKGVYLLKFDNSYSFWRSKTLYYRVYYTK